MEENKSTQQNQNATEKTSSDIYPGTDGIRKLHTEETPHEILSADFPNRPWPISGGWGYTKDDAVVLEYDDDALNTRLEYQFLRFRTYEECIVFQPGARQLCNIELNLVQQSLCKGDDGTPYDRVTMQVTAIEREKMLALAQDFLKNDGYKNNPEKRDANLKARDNAKVTFQVTAWFNISHSFGKKH